jgi:hypothetical protein
MMFRAVLLILLEGTILAQAPVLLDLAANPAKPWYPPAISGTFGGACFDCPAKPELKLPLEIRIESIEPLPDSPQQSLVNMLVRNVGSEGYSLPVGRDPEVALQATNHGRHEFCFDLKVAGERYSYLSGQETYGSTDVPDTMMSIAPQGVVHVRFKIDVAKALRHAPNHWQSEPPAKINVQAATVDLVYEDDAGKYVLRSPQLDAVSTNELLVRIVRDKEPGLPLKK